MGVRSASAARTAHLIDSVQGKKREKITKKECKARRPEKGKSEEDNFKQLWGGDESADMIGKGRKTSRMARVAERCGKKRTRGNPSMRRQTSGLGRIKQGKSFGTLLQGLSHRAFERLRKGAERRGEGGL